MSATFKKGDLVQSISGGPVMKVVALRTGAAGEAVVDTILVHGNASEPAHFAPAGLKIIGIDRDDSDDDDFDDDRGE
jgi:hypothetical protein